MEGPSLEMRDKFRNGKPGMNLETGGGGGTFSLLFEQ